VFSYYWIGCRNEECDNYTPLWVMKDTQLGAIEFWNMVQEGNFGLYIPTASGHTESAQ